MKKSYSDALNKSTSRANKLVSLNPGANEFVPKSNDSWPRVNNHNRHENAPSPPHVYASIQGARLNQSPSPIVTDEPKIGKTITTYSSDGNRFCGKRGAGYQESKTDSGSKRNNRGKSENSSEKSIFCHNRNKMQDRRGEELSKEHFQERESKIEKHIFKTEQHGAAVLVDYPDPVSPETANQSSRCSTQNNFDDERTASAPVANISSWREKKQKKDNFSKAGRSSLPLQNNDRRTSNSKLDDDPRMEREKLNIAEPLSKCPQKTQIKTRWSTSLCAESDKEKKELDTMFSLWHSKWHIINRSQDTASKVVNEIFGDLFEQPKEFSLAHCVAEDLRMGSGIAVSFKREFKSVPDLLDQRAKQGGLATLFDEPNNRFVYYLVTKKESIGKPTYFTLWKSLCKMRNHIKENKVKKIAIPRLACGLDRLEWDKVKSMLVFLFENLDVEIRVCNFQQNAHDKEKKSVQCRLVTQNYHITEIERDTIILYFTTCKGEEDDVMCDLSKKSKFLPSFRKNPKALGDIVFFEDHVQNWGLCGCVVRETASSPLSFRSLQKCLQKVNKKNDGYRDERFNYIAIQWLDSSSYHDELINEKSITVLTTYLRNVTVCVCQGSLNNY